MESESGANNKFCPHHTSAERGLPLEPEPLISQGICVDRGTINSGDRSSHREANLVPA